MFSFLSISLFFQIFLISSRNESTNELEHRKIGVKAARWFGGEKIRTAGLFASEDHEIDDRWIFLVSYI